MPTRNASAVWEGGLRGGKGSFKGESGTIAGSYSVGSRFSDGERGTNPEELLAAAEASCYSMALSGELERAGTPPTRIETRAACTVEKVADGFKITTMKLVVRATVPNASPEKFREIAEATKAACPVSKALTGVKIDVDAALTEGKTEARADAQTEARA
jgi:lipoyl-dependent peroxiredoxin